MTLMLTRTLPRIVFCALWVTSGMALCATWPRTKAADDDGDADGAVEFGAAVRAGAGGGVGFAAGLAGIGAGGFPVLAWVSADFAEGVGDAFGWGSDLSGDFFAGAEAGCVTGCAADVVTGSVADFATDSEFGCSVAGAEVAAETGSDSRGFGAWRKNRGMAITAPSASTNATACTM